MLHLIPAAVFAAIVSLTAVLSNKGSSLSSFVSNLGFLSPNPSFQTRACEEPTSSTPTASFPLPSTNFLPDLSWAISIEKGWSDSFISGNGSNVYFLDSVATAFLRANRISPSLTSVPSDLTVQQLRDFPQAQNAMTNVASPSDSDPVQVRYLSGFLLWVALPILFGFIASCIYAPCWCGCRCCFKVKCCLAGPVRETKIKERWAWRAVFVLLFLSLFSATMIGLSSVSILSRGVESHVVEVGQSAVTLATNRLSLAHHLINAVDSVIDQIVQLNNTIFSYLPTENDLFGYKHCATDRKSVV